MGAAYFLADPGAASTGPSTYRLEEVEISGAMQVYGPFVLTPYALRPSIRQTPQGLLLSWFSRDGELYRVLRAPVLDATFLPVAEDLPAILPVNEYLDPWAGASRGFYRIEVQE